jgi:thioredoxin reductase (NADPH)
LEPRSSVHEVVIIGGGIAGLSAAIYLGRAKRDAIIVDSGKSMARWEPDVQNYLGFPKGIAGEELLRLGVAQARRYGTRIERDEIVNAARKNGVFQLIGRSKTYHAPRVLIATGIFHLPPQIDGVDECLGHSMFFCKDCDGFRVQGKKVLIYGWNNEATEYALSMLLYSPAVGIVTDGRPQLWSKQHEQWLREHCIPVYAQPIEHVERTGSRIRGIIFKDKSKVAVEALFTTRGDVSLNKIAKALGARIDPEGQVEIDARMATNVKGLYAAGCVTPANCQMIIAAGEGAKAAQAINHDLFRESLTRQKLKRIREKQLPRRNARTSRFSEPALPDGACAAKV